MTPRNDYYNDILLQEIASCQRNFDQTQQIPTEIELELDEWVGKAPQQCGELNYNIIKIKDHECSLNLSKICSATEEYEENTIYQPQLNGYITYVWTIPDESWFTTRNLEYDKSEHKFHAGFASGLVAMKATSLGLKTGFTRCGPWTDSMWNQFLHTYNLNGEKHSKFCFALGVGYPVKDKPYYWQEDLGNHEHLKPDFPEIDIL